jgi:hypothetical protein
MNPCAARPWMRIAGLDIGGSWWQQTLWKLPPRYTDHLDSVSVGLRHWVGKWQRRHPRSWPTHCVWGTICSSGSGEKEATS